MTPRLGHINRTTCLLDEKIVAQYLFVVQQVVARRPEVFGLDFWEGMYTYYEELIHHLGVAANS